MNHIGRTRLYQMIPLLLSSMSIHLFLSAHMIHEIGDELLNSQTNQLTLTDYVYNPHVPIEVWNQLKPHFLPIYHPVKQKLDCLFRNKRVTLTEETFIAAGFSITRHNRPINAIVTGHQELPGYLLKVYLDNQLALPEWHMWLKRIQGAEITHKCIKKHGYTDFVLPRKWIYPLPAEPSPPLDNTYNRKNFILVVEDMKILNNEDNTRAYKQKMTRRLLNALYTVLTECQLTDCVYIGNMPFTKYGKIAFIDTELFFNGPPDFSRLKKYLSTAMQTHLEKLMRKDSPIKKETK